jgi:hypothetical protein
MIRAEAMKVGLVVFDPQAVAPDDSRRWFKIVNESDLGWHAEKLEGGQTKIFDLDDLPRLRAASAGALCSVDLTSVLGKRVRLVMDVGSVTGEVWSIPCVTIRLGEDPAADPDSDQEIQIPMSINLSGEFYLVRRLSEIVVLDR